MSGSKKNFRYGSNLVVGDYSIYLDESNTEAVNGSGFDLTATDNVIGAISIDRSAAVEPRYIFFVGALSSGAKVVKQVVWLNPNTFFLSNFAIVIFPFYLADGSVEQVACRPSIVAGEKYHYGGGSADSGILDGDQD